MDKDGDRWHDQVVLIQWVQLLSLEGQKLFASYKDEITFIVRHF